MQHTFRVRPRALPVHTSSDPSLGGIVEHRWTRRPHAKSKLGCESCRKRRKKCDERKPSCSSCLQKHSSCVYPDANPSHRSRRATPPFPTSTVTPSPWPGPRTLPVLAAENAYTKYDLFLIDHFVRTAAQYFELPGAEGVYSSKAVELAKEYPLIMHAMLAVSACHMQHLGTEARHFRMPEAFHCRLAVLGLQKAVVSINGAREADSVLTTSMLLNALVSTTEDYLEDDQIVKGGLQWGWLRFEIGLTDLLRRTKPYHPDSIWLPMFMSFKSYPDMEPPCNELDRQLAELCEINRDRSMEQNPYFDFWEQLAPLITRPHGIKYLRLYVNAVGGIDFRFIELLEKGDSRAMILFAHWSALMCSIEIWCTSRRLKKICWAICQDLQPRLGEADLSLLDIPAEIIGFPLRGRVACSTA